MAAGIERIDIITSSNGRGAWRFKIARPYHPFINQIYWSLFSLWPNCEYLRCTKDDKIARHDIEYGVDVRLNYLNGLSGTVQEKILTTTYETLTVEYYQNPLTNQEGDWFNLKCDYYFVGYANSHKSVLDRWILLDWPRTKLLSDKIAWKIKNNKQDGAKSNFKYAHFNDFPDECVIAKYLNNIYYTYKSGIQSNPSDPFLIITNLALSGINLRVAEDNKIMCRGNLSPNQRELIVAHREQIRSHLLQEKQNANPSPHP